MPRYVCTEDGSNKFWEGAVEGSALTTRWGKVGTAGQTKTKAFADEAAARAELASLENEKLGKGYVRDAAGPSGSPPSPVAAASPAAPPPAAATPARRAKGAEFPFLFYGRRPPHAHEAAMGGHVYEVCFVDAPDEARRGALAQALVKKAKKGAATVSSLVRLSGRHALFDFAETWATAGRGEQDLDAFYDHVDAILRALHAVAQIEQVVYETATAPGEHPWDTWTRAQRPQPAPGAPHRDFVRRGELGGTTDPSLPIGEVDPAFTRATLVAILGEDAVKAREVEEARIRASGQIAVLSVPRSTVPPRPEVPPSARKLLQREVKGNWVLMLGASRSRRVLARIPVDPQFNCELVLLDEDGQIKRLGHERHDSTLKAMRPDGGAALVYDWQDGEVLLEVSLPEGANRELLRAPVTAATYVHETQIAVRTKTQLVILDIGGPAPVRVASLEVPGTSSARGPVSLRGGQLIVVEEDAPVVFGVDGTRIEILSPKVIGQTANLYAVGDRVFGFRPNFVNAEEIVNLDVAFARFMAGAA